MGSAAEVFATAMAFSHEIARRSASTIHEFADGFVVRSIPEFAISNEHNRVIVTREASATDVLPICDVHLGDLDQQAISWDHESHTAHVAAMHAAGYDASVDLVMALDVPFGIGSSTVAARIPGEQLEASVEAAWERAGISPPDASTLTARRRLLEQAVPVEYFAVRENGEFVSHCELRHTDGIAQIDAVLTDPRYQQRGHARHVLSAAIHRADELGCHLVFLCTDADDWPQHFYRRLGFRTIGDTATFTR